MFEPQQRSAMTNDDDTKFALSTGDIATSIRNLAKSSTIVADVANIWLDILGIFFPDDQGFRRTRILSTEKRVLIQVQRDRYPDGDVFVDDDDTSRDLQFRSAEDSSQVDVSFKFGVISFGAQVVFLKDVSSYSDDQGAWSLHGEKTGSSNLVKATGRDMAEEWLRKMKDICDG
ncbi:hypothetical protein TSTA_067830 [Talaromyces stipitatus ATCC 10500]|uniref:Uncharacterized protein n=1 Tax=Talaromyces stipitatus (strain ATCC 10500 / CBS 375.48 / QM 6759 / NRRL 1006) TaxID=441959 RepID=B8LYJ6_TALSN|nr:uncharacterized protein TSTA_067830 [Talaromyces stipitatus ATCC 10500]EED23354.1 hypothetical protein TSTA_067830 [Talaromyces stipitatus ATCC 10500]